MTHEEHILHLLSELKKKDDEIDVLIARAEAAEARAEALERAMYTSTLGYYGGDSCCYFCKYGPEGTEEQISYTESTTNAGSEAEWDCKLCNGSTINQRGGWQFDQARFEKGGGRDGNT